MRVPAELRTAVRERSIAYNLWIDAISVRPTVVRKGFTGKDRTAQQKADIALAWHLFQNADREMEEVLAKHNARLAERRRQR